MAAEAKPIGSRVFDNLFELESGRTLGIEGHDLRLSVSYGFGYRYAQVFTPAGKDIVCMEPMTAPTNALVSGEYVVVPAGESFTARFRIRPERIATR